MCGQKRRKKDYICYYSKVMQIIFINLHEWWKEMQCTLTIWFFHPVNVFCLDRCLHSASISLVLVLFWLGSHSRKEPDSLSSFFLYISICPHNLIILCPTSPSTNETGKHVITWGFFVHLIWYTFVNKWLFYVNAVQNSQHDRFTVFYITSLTEVEGAGVYIRVLRQYHTAVVPFILLLGLGELQGEVLGDDATEAELREHRYTFVVGDAVFPVAVQYIHCTNRVNLSHVNPNWMPHQTETEIAHPGKLVCDSLLNYRQLTKPRTWSQK